MGSPVSPKRSSGLKYIYIIRTPFFRRQAPICIQQPNEKKKHTSSHSPPEAGTSWFHYGEYDNKTGLMTTPWASSRGARFP